MIVLGQRVPSIAVYSLIGLGIYLITRSAKNGVSTGLSNLFKSDTEIQEDKILKDIFKTLEKNPGVQSQMTVANKATANELYDCMHGLGTRTQGIFTIFRKISGPNEMGAIFLAYGKRTLGLTTLSTFPSTHSGDLIGALRSELSSSELKQNLNPDPKGVKFNIETKLAWLTNF